MQVLMKFNGVPQRCHFATHEMTPLCGFHADEHVWGCFELPDVMLDVLPICGMCSQKAHPHALELRDRCAAFGWELRIVGAGYELVGNGSDAVFTNEESLTAWLEKQER